MKRIRVRIFVREFEFKLHISVTYHSLYRRDDDIQCSECHSILRTYPYTVALAHSHSSICGENVHRHILNSEHCHIQFLSRLSVTCRFLLSVHIPYVSRPIVEYCDRSWERRWFQFILTIFIVTSLETCPIWFLFSPNEVLQYHAFVS